MPGLVQGSTRVGLVLSSTCAGLNESVGLDVRGPERECGLDV